LTLLTISIEIWNTRYTQLGETDLFKIENPRRRGSELIGFAIDQICSWFQVSGVRCQQIPDPVKDPVLSEAEAGNTDLAATEDQHWGKRVHFMSDSVAAG
jgi:hypothetical protein